MRITPLQHYQQTCANVPRLLESPKRTRNRATKEATSPLSHVETPEWRQFSILVDRSMRIAGDTPLTLHEYFHSSGHVRGLHDAGEARADQRVKQRPHQNVVQKPPPPMGYQLLVKGAFNVKPVLVFRAAVMVYVRQHRCVLANDPGSRGQNLMRA